MCDSPITVFPKFKDRHGLLIGALEPQENRSYPVPCGQCSVCRTKRINSWKFRLKQQDKVSKSCIFVTLTYDTQFVPISSNGFMNLNPDHLTKFFKLLRIRQERLDDLPKNWEKIKYYACGEYGTRKYRPHYHIILFNVYSFALIQECWKYGKIDLQTDAKEGSFAYTAGYISKPHRIPMHKNDDRVKEFSRMSKGIGADYVEKTKRWHLADVENRAYVMDGKVKYPMPRYYKNKIYKAWHLVKLGQKAEKLMSERRQKIIDSGENLEISENDSKIARTEKYNFFIRNKNRE